MPIKIAIPAPLRQFASGQSQIEVEAKTAGEALDLITSTHAPLRKHLFNEQNRLRNFVNVYLNDEDIRHASGPDTPLKDGDTIMIVPSIAGGAVIESEVGQTLPELSHEEILRYSRHLIMPEVGMQRQRRLKDPSALMIGTGGLGQRHCRLRRRRRIKPAAPDHSRHERPRTPQDRVSARSFARHQSAHRDRNARVAFDEPQRDAALSQLRHHRRRYRQLPDALSRERRMRAESQAERLRIDFPL